MTHIEIVWNYYVTVYQSYKKSTFFDLMSLSFDLMSHVTIFLDLMSHV